MFSCLENSLHGGTLALDEVTLCYRRTFASSVYEPEPEPEAGEEKIRKFLRGEREMEGQSFSGVGNGGGGGQHQVVDGKLIQTFHKSFVQVQSILDQNRMLISEINQNHESGAPDSLTRNVGLIRELNNNIRRVAGLYADLSASFAHRGASSEGDSSGTLRSSDAAAGQKRVRPD